MLQQAMFLIPDALLLAETTSKIIGITYFATVRIIDILGGSLI